MTEYDNPKITNLFDDTEGGESDYVEIDLPIFTDKKPDIKTATREEIESFVRRNMTFLDDDEKVKDMVDRWIDIQNKHKQEKKPDEGFGI